jgi:hypothetical protein
MVTTRSQLTPEHRGMLRDFVRLIYEMDQCRFIEKFRAQDHTVSGGTDENGENYDSGPDYLATSWSKSFFLIGIPPEPAETRFEVAVGSRQACFRGHSAFSCPIPVPRGRESMAPGTFALFRFSSRRADWSLSASRLLGIDHGHSFCPSGRKKS